MCIWTVWYRYRYCTTEELCSDCIWGGIQHACRIHLSEIYMQPVLTYIEGPMAVVNMNLSLAVSKEDDLAVRGPLDMSQHQSLQLLAPDPIAINCPYNHCTWEMEKKEREGKRREKGGVGEAVVSQTRSICI